MSDGAVKYWKNITDLTEEEMQSGKYKFRETDGYRISAYYHYLFACGEDISKQPCDADFMNKLEDWFLDLAVDAINKKLRGDDK